MEVVSASALASVPRILHLGMPFGYWIKRRSRRRLRARQQFFRYDSRSKVIVYAWVNDENTLRSSGSKSDPYTVFLKMLSRGNPPDTWDLLLRQSKKIKL